MSTSADDLMHDVRRSPSLLSPLSDSHSDSPTLSVNATPSVYLTFKVAQLVNTFCDRVKSRVQSTRKPPPKKSQANFCQDFDRLAYEEIDRYLGRKTAHSPTKGHVPTGLTACTTKKRSSVSIEWLLNQINQAVKAETNSLLTVAACDRLFIQRKAELFINADRLSTPELTHLLIIVKDLLRSLSQLRSPGDYEDCICEGTELLDVNFDEACVANLEHLLLCLKDQLIRLLITRLVKLVHKHIVDCQRDQGHHSESWFFEYPNAQRPLSTTWPWSIRPSLAVLWGVCWMFIYDTAQGDNRIPPRRAPTFRFDSFGNWIDERGLMIATASVVEQFLRQSQQQQYADLHRGDGRQVQVPRPHHVAQVHAIPHSSEMAAPQSLGNNRGLLPTTHTLSPSPIPRTSGESRTLDAPSLRAPTALLNYQAGATGLTHAVSDAFALPGTNNTYHAAPPPVYVDGPARHLWPQATAFNYDNSATNRYQTEDAWNSFPPQPTTEQHQAAAFSVPAQNLPPRSRHPSTPAIITTDFNPNFGNNADFQGGPQEPYSATTPVASASSLHPEDSYNFPPFNRTQLSPHSMNSEPQDMNTPPLSPGHALGGGEPLSRKRSHSDISRDQMAPQSNHSRSGSVVSMSGHSPGGGYSPRTRAFKRDEPPPMNAEHKIICTFAPECAGLVFDRKCEWTKHMDKHDRPYRCSNPACAKLQGFTYSGGLLRHEREVHNKHGGPKSALMCPYKDCKRHNGKGFTRKENLNEHIRRVHQSKDEQGQTMSLKRDAGMADVFPGAEEIAAATGEMEPFDSESHLSPARKRRRHDPVLVHHEVVNGGPVDVEELQREVDYLRQELSNRDNRILEMELKLEEEKGSRQEEMARLHDSHRLVQQQLQQLQQAQAPN